MTRDIIIRPRPALLPELIIIISQLLIKPSDLLSFALVCKRFSSILLKSIRDPSSKQARALLEAFSSPRMQIYNESLCEIDTYSLLPDLRQHGKWEEFKVKKDAIQTLMPSVASLEPLVKGWHGVSVKKPETTSMIWSFIEKALKSGAAVKIRETAFWLGQQHGHLKNNYPDGTEKDNTHFEYDIREGLALTYYPSGKLKSTVDYKKDIIQEETQFDETGKVTSHWKLESSHSASLPLKPLPSVPRQSEQDDVEAILTELNLASPIQNSKNQLNNE